MKSKSDFPNCILKEKSKSKMTALKDRGFVGSDFLEKIEYIQTEQQAIEKIGKSKSTAQKERSGLLL